MFQKHPRIKKSITFLLVVIVLVAQASCVVHSSSNPLADLSGVSSMRVPFTSDPEEKPPLAQINSDKRIAQNDVLGVDFPTSTSNKSGFPQKGGTLNMVAIPDTQYYPLEHPATFDAMTKWISDNWDIENFDVVVHLGDIVQKVNDEPEWEKARYSMSILSPHPFTVLPGNHDYVYNSTGNHDYSTFNKYFPLSILNPFSYSYDFPQGTLINNCVVVKGYLILSIGFYYNKPNPDLIEWIRAVMSNNSNLPVIVVTHDFLLPSSELSVSGNALWDVIKDYPNLFLILSGHAWLPDNSDRQEKQRVLEGLKGNKVNVIMSNYQEYLGRNSGCIRIYGINSENISIRTFSPRYGFLTDGSSQFVLLR